MVDDYLNKRVIKDKEPQRYVGDFEKVNSDMKVTLESHFIDLYGFGIHRNDYDLFLEQRSSKLADEILKRI